MRNQMFKIILICFFAGITNAQHDLAYKVKPGDKFKIYQSSTQEISQDMAGQLHKMTTTIEGDFTFVVEAVNDDVIEFRFKYDRFLMKTNSNLAGEVMNVDTALIPSGDDMMGQMLFKMIGIDMKLFMSKTGKIKEIQGSDALLDNMVSVFPDLDEATKAQIKKSMEVDFGSQSLSESFEQMTYIYPTTIVNPGDSWKNVFNGDLKSSNTWTFEEITKEGLLISGLSDVDFDTTTESLEMNLTGTMKTSITADAETGFLKQMHVVSNVEGSSELLQMPDQQFPTRVKTTTDYRVDKLK